MVVPEPYKLWRIDQVPTLKGSPECEQHRTRCEDEDAAWEWIKFCLSDEAQLILGRSGRGIPARRSMALKSVPDPRTPQHEEYFLEAMDKYSHRSSLHFKWMATEQQVFNPEWDRVTAGDITIPEWVRNTQHRAHKMMWEDYP